MTVKKFLKHSWHRGGDKPQQRALNERTDATHMLVKSETKRYSHCFTTVSKEIFLSWLEGDFGLYEIIEPHKPSKGYFDIDFKTGAGVEPRLNEILLAFKSIFPHGDFQVSGSRSDKKVSYHICVNNYVFRNQEERECLKYLCLTDEFKAFYADEGVYTKNRCMKCVNQSKAIDNGERVQEVLDGFSQDLRKHIITEFFPDEVYYAVDEHDFTQYIPDEKERYAKQTGVKEKLVWAHLPELRAEDMPALPLLKSIYDLDNEGDYKSILWAIPNPPYSSGREHSHNTIWNIMRWAHGIGISFTDFILWVQQRDGNNTRAYAYQWEHLKNYNYMPKPTISLFPLFKKYSPQLLKDKSKMRFDYINTLQADRFIYTPWLRLKDINTPNKYALLYVGMGGNKTGVIAEYLHKHPNASWLWITPRITLGQNTRGRVGESDFYKDFYGKKSKEIVKSKRLIIQLQSLWKIQGCFYDYLIIDEIESVLQAWTAVHTHGKNGMNLKTNWDTFKALLLGAKKCFFMDAFMTKRTTELIENIEREAPPATKKEWFQEETPLYTVVARHPSVQTEQREMVVMKGFDSLYAKLITKIREGKKVYVFYPFGASGNALYPSMEEFKARIVRASGLDENEVLAYWKNTDDKHLNNLENASEAWGNLRVVIANTKITVGVNFDNITKMFDDVFLFYIAWVFPRDIAQSSYRARHLRGRIYTAKMTNRGGGNQGKELPPIENDKTFTALYNSLMDEENAKCWEVFIWFCEQAGYKMVKDETETMKLAEVLDNEDCLEVGYNDIEDLPEDLHNDVYTRQITGHASLNDKLRLEKYFLEKEFKPKTPQTVLSTAWKYRNILPVILDVKRNPGHILHKIAREQGWQDCLNPPPHGVKDLKLSKELREEIESQFKFRNYLRDSPAGYCIHKVYSILLGRYIVETDERTQKNGKNHSVYSVQEGLADDLGIWKPEPNMFDWIWDYN
jgi:hypothetical protein